MTAVGMVIINEHKATAEEVTGTGPQEVVGGPGAVAHTCNFSYSGGRRGRIAVPGPAWVSKQDLVFKRKGLGDVAQWQSKCPPLGLVGRTVLCHPHTKTFYRRSDNTSGSQVKISMQIRSPGQPQQDISWSVVCLTPLSEALGRPLQSILWLLLNEERNRVSFIC